MTLSLVKKVLEGNQKAAARIIRMIEDNEPNGIESLKKLYPHFGQSIVVGITGPPGVGKSTITDHITTEFRKKKLTVGVLTIDPTSPITGGALLGDRLRMSRHSGDPGVFIRSMATRGHHGGLSKAAMGALIVMDTMGHDIIIVETTGVGQGDVEIKDLAHTTVLIMMPGMGDQIQCMKAGILEIGDIFIINKCDRKDALQSIELFKIMLSTWTISENGWHPRVIGTTAIQHEGIPELVETLNEHHQFLSRNKMLKEFESRREIFFFNNIMNQKMPEKVMEYVISSNEYQKSTRKITSNEIDPFSAAEILVKKLKVNFSAF